MQTTISKTNGLTLDKTYIFRLFISIIIFLSSGILSTYLYYHLHEKGGVFFPGLVYTSSTILIFLLTKKTFAIKKLLIYYMLMNLTYIVMWLLTYLSSWFAMLGGIVTAGVGAIVTFVLVDKFVTPIKFGKPNVFLIGGLAFLLTDILALVSMGTVDQHPLAYLFKLEFTPQTLFMEVFLFWHTLVGIKLFVTLEKPE